MSDPISSTSTSSSSSTLALAQRLGLVRSRKIGGKRGQAGRTESQQFFHYLIVIDFEATCWDRDRASSVPSPPSEIIEFPAVLMRTSDGALLDVFHTYVLPTETPKLSDFAKTLTGITQAQVDEGVPIGTALMLFTRWLDEMRVKHKFVVNDVKEGEQRASFVTWSDWDLNVCLSYECKRKQLRKPDCFNAWGDLRHIYSKFYDRRPNGLNGALQDVGVTFEGREHSGLCDARNTAKLAFKLIQDGCCIVVTKYTIGAHIHPRLKNMTVSTATNDVKRQFTVINDSKSVSIDTTVPSVLRQVARKPVFKRTPPMCQCGRRARVLTVQSPGENVGRSFFACPNSNKQARCKFFKWEDLGNSPVLSVRNTNTSAVIPPPRSTETWETPMRSHSLTEGTGNRIGDMSGQYFGNVPLFHPSGKEEEDIVAGKKKSILL